MENAIPGLVLEHTYRQLPDKFYQLVAPNSVKAPELLKLNQQLAVELGMDLEKIDKELLARVLTGDVAAEGDTLLSMAYSGHQFGHFNPYMGDGRAALIGEVVDRNGKRRDLQLKGSGRTPFSRQGDGKAGLGPVMREYIVSEAMFALGIPTTRSLSIAKTGEFIFRDGPAPGAVLTRVAASHLRIGTFQYFAARGDVESVRTLADYAINRHFSDRIESENPYLQLLNMVIELQASLVAKWMGVGFIHGVMNTDNMTISGETIDYGPCAFMDHYDHNKVYSSIDREGRYAFGAQPTIAQWNLARLAEALLPILDEDRDTAMENAKAALDEFPVIFMNAWHSVMASKFGLIVNEDEPESQRDLMRKFLTLLHRNGTDFTNSFRYLQAILSEKENTLEGIPQDFKKDAEFTEWQDQWKEQIGFSTAEKEAAHSRMSASNPVYIPRNHLVEEAIAAGEQDNDFAPMEALLERITSPFVPLEGFERFERPPNPDEVVQQTFCGT